MARRIERQRPSWAARRFWLLDPATRTWAACSRRTYAGSILYYRQYPYDGPRRFARHVVRRPAAPLPIVQMAEPAPHPTDHFPPIYPKPLILEGLHAPADLSGPGGPYLSAWPAEAPMGKTGPAPTCCGQTMTAAWYSAKGVRTWVCESCKTVLRDGPNAAAAVVKPQQHQMGQTAAPTCCGGEMDPIPGGWVCELCGLAVWREP